MKEKVGDLFFQPYNEEQENVVLVGPIPGEQYQEIISQCFHLIRQRIKTSIMVNIPFI